MNAYARSINKAYERTGSLFQRPFGRIEVTSEAYFSRLVIYIHQNPQKHGFVADFRDWPTRLKRDDVVVWFGSLENLSATHHELILEREMQALAPEDFD